MAREKKDKKSKEEPAKKKAKKAKDEPTSKKAKKSKEEPAKKTKKTKPEPETEKKKKKSKEEPEAKKKSKKARERDEDDEDEDDKPSKKSKKAGTGSKKGDQESGAFNPYGDIDATLDGIEKHYGLLGTSVSAAECRQHSSSLCLDLTLAGGLLPGMYVFFGPEQSCKSTLATAVAAACIDMSVPIISYHDAEGCVVHGTKVRVNDKTVDIGSLFEGLPAGYTKVSDMFAETPDGTHAVNSLYCKDVERTFAFTTDSGVRLEGYGHPVPVERAGVISMLDISDVREGDVVFVR